MNKTKGTADGPCPNCKLHHYNIAVEYLEPADDGGTWWQLVEPFTCECGQLIAVFHHPPPMPFVFAIPAIAKQDNFLVCDVALAASGESKLTTSK